jgi:hypothetical protein
MRTITMAILATTLSVAATARAGDEAYFPAGTKDVMVYAGYATPVLGDNERYYSAGVSGGYYFWDDVALSVSVVGHGVDPSGPGQDALAGELNLMFRKHFFGGDRWTFFGEAGAGLMYADHNLPGEGHGTQWNFTPQFGVGVTWKLDENWHLVAGVRAFHASNAGLAGDDRHPGSNALMGWVGTMWVW